MSNYFNLNKAAESMNKDYQYMEQHTPEMNQPISANSQNPYYDPKQSLKDAMHDAEKKFGTREGRYSNVFLWAEEKDVWMKTAKYQEFSDKTNKELKEYSTRYTNHSARKRAGSSATAKSYYKKYNQKMMQLSNMAEELNVQDDVNSQEAFKEVKRFFEQTMEALDLRELAMKASAEVKSTSQADENFRKAKVARMIIAQKLRLAEKYRDKYNENRETRELGDYFQEQCDKIREKFVLNLYDYKMAYLAARGSVDRLKLEEIKASENEQVNVAQVANEQEENVQIQNEQAQNAQNELAENQQVQNAQKEHFDVKNDTTPAKIMAGQITSQFGKRGTNQWRTKLREGQSRVCVNKNLRDVREVLDEISAQQGGKYADQLNRIQNWGKHDGNIYKKHSEKGHSYSKNDEIVFRFDLLGTKGSVDVDAESIEGEITNIIGFLTAPNLVPHGKKELKEYFDWLKNVKHHESMENCNLDDAKIYTAKFRGLQNSLVTQDKNLLVDYYSYKKYGKNNDTQNLERVNKGIRIRQAERNATEEKKTLREGQVRELITIQGCDQYLGGGKYSIESSAQYMRELAKNRLIPLFERWAAGEAEPKTIHFMMDGVSRGGVNASLGAMAINGWVSEAYPQYVKYVKYDIIQRDPVPGPSTATQKDSIRIGGAANDQELDKNGCIKGTNYKPLSKASTNSTVFYALHPNVGPASPFYQPQRVYGANRIILSPFEHADDGKIPGVFDDLVYKKKTGKSRAMLNNSNGEFYAGSGVSDLDDGVYILDEYSTLTKINSYEDAEKILNLTRNDGIYSKRKARILDVVKDWFMEHRDAQGGNVANGR